MSSESSRQGGSTDAVDAHVVVLAATTLSPVLTSDPDDLRRLSSQLPTLLVIRRICSLTSWYGQFAAPVLCSEIGRQGLPRVVLAHTMLRFTETQLEGILPSAMLNPSSTLSLLPSA